MNIHLTGKDSFFGRNLYNYLYNKGYGFVHKKDIDSNTAIINCEALIMAPESLKHPMKFFNVNVVKTMKLLEFGRKKDCRFIQPSSNLTYGNPVYSIIDEEHPQNPQSPYAATRVAQESMAMSYYRSYNLPVTILRFSNLYGPKGKGVINVFIKNVLKNKPLIIKGGRQTRTYTYSEDACQGVHLSLKNRKSIGEIFNIAGPETVSIFELADIFKDLNFNVKVIKKSHDRGDITSSNFEISIEKARRILNYNPIFDLKLGIIEIMRQM